MQKIGELLRKKREEQGISLKEIENATSIRSGFLAAIEEGSIHNRISSIYALGFTKQYAAFLGFDVEGIMRQYPTAFKAPAQKHEFSYGIGTLEIRGSHGGGVKWLPSLLWGLAGVFTIMLTYYLLKVLGIL